jgi:hypothetical protein
MTMYNGLYVMYNMCSIFGFLAIFHLELDFVFHCVTSSGHEVKLRKHGHDVIMRSSLCVTGLGGYGDGCSRRGRGAMLGARSSS